MLASACIGTPFLLKFLQKTPPKIFSCVSPKRKTLAREINVTGQLEIKDSLKIGTLVAGTVEAIFVSEGQQVAKGTVLAKINNGKQDVEVQLTRAESEQIAALLLYQKNHFSRIKELHLENFVSQDEFELERSKLSELESRHQAALARLQRAEIEFGNTEIRAPRDGKITAIRVTEGQTVTATLEATVLFELASDVTALQAVFEVDEADVAWIEPGQEVELELCSKSDAQLKTKIDTVGLTPRIKNGITFFKVFASISDPEQHLRAGTSVSGIITTSKIFDALTLPGQVFYLATEAVTAAAAQLKYKVFELPAQKTHRHKKFIWIFNTDTFEQKEIETGINDNVDFQILSELSEKTQVLQDIDEKNLNEELFKKAFKKL